MAGSIPTRPIIPQRSFGVVGKESSKTPPNNGAKEDPTVWLKPKKPIYRPRQSAGADSATTEDAIGEKVISPAVIMAIETSAQLNSVIQPSDA
jgi:hypothetical protein